MYVAQGSLLTRALCRLPLSVPHKLYHTRAQSQHAVSDSNRYRQRTELPDATTAVPKRKMSANSSNQTPDTNGAHQSPIPKITLYTNHGCPFAQRAHIALDELKLPYDEILIDLGSPRPQWYLDINPRGLVPTLKYSLPNSVYPEATISESAIVAKFLCEAHESHLLPSSPGRGKEEGPLAETTAALRAEVAHKRAQIEFFVDTWMSKIAPSQFAILRATTPEDKLAKLDETLTLIRSEIEPLLDTAKPFFGGSEKLTLAEVLIAPFVMRWMTLGDDGEMVPKVLKAEVEKLPNFAAWVEAVLGHETATRMFNRESFLESTKKRLEKAKEVSKV
jgi:glutathione S-transferase